MSVAEFGLIPDVEGLRHDLLVEFVNGPDGPTLLGFLGAFEQHLQTENHEYRSKRGSGRLGAPQLFVMRAGWSEELCRIDFRNGRRELQHKWQSVGVPWDENSRANVVARVDYPW